jgi:hypothetical protein
MFLSALGSASLATLAGCNSNSESQSVESAAISSTPLADIASIIPQVDPLVMSAWRLPAGGAGNTVQFEERTDTLRYNTVNSRLAPNAVGAYLLSGEAAPFVGPLWLGYSENGLSTPWFAVIAGVSVIYGDSNGLATVRSRLDSVDVEYETVTDSDNAVILRGSNGGVVGVTSKVFAFVPAIDESTPFSKVSRVTALIETATHERESLASQDSLLNTTLRKAKLQGIVHLTHSQDAPLGEALPAHRRTIDGDALSVTGSATGYEPARTAVCQLDGVQEAPVSATATIRIPDIEDIDESELIANVGNRGAERKYVRDEEIVRVSCEYPQDALSEVLSDSSIGVGSESVRRVRL